MVLDAGLLFFLGGGSEPEIATEVSSSTSNTSACAAAAPAPDVADTGSVAAETVFVSRSLRAPSIESRIPRSKY